MPTWQGKATGKTTPEEDLEIAALRDLGIGKSSSGWAMKSSPTLAAVRAGDGAKGEASSPAPSLEPPPEVPKPPAPNVMDEPVPPALVADAAQPT